MKLGIEFQYHLNKDGTSPDEVLGGDYKTRLKPALASLGDEIKKTSKLKWEELISLQQQSQENVVKLEAKRKHLDALQADIDAVCPFCSLMDATYHIQAMSAFSY